MNERSENGWYFSKLGTIQNCMYRYKLEYLDKVPHKGSMSDALVFGSALHAGLEQLFRGQPLIDALEFFRIFWGSYKDKDVAWDRFSWSELNNMGAEFLRKFEKQHLRSILPEIVEERIYGTIGHYPFEGTPDLAGSYKGVPSIIDFKTSAYRYDPLKIETAEQLVGYDYLLRQADRYKAEQIVYFVFVKTTGSIQTPIIKHLTDQMRRDTMSNITAWIAEMQERTVYPKNKKSCFMGKHKCPYFSNCHGLEENKT